MMRTSQKAITHILVIFFLVVLVSSVHASTTLYLRNTAASDPQPTIIQSSDTIFHDAATSRATYASPANMLPAAGTASQTNQGTFGGTILNHKTHYGSFISPPLYAQTISGTVSLGLIMRESNAASHNIPRIYLYVWKSDNTGRRCDLIPLTNAGMEVTTAYPVSPTLYFSAVPVTECTISADDRIVLEIETDDFPSVSTAYSHGFRFGGAAGGGYGSYLTFGQDLYWTIIPGFTANRTSGTCDLPIRFTDTSTNSPTSWYWDFGDGENSTLQNPVHVYRQAGTFDVTLQACNPGGCSVKNVPGMITTTMVAGFTATPTSGRADLPVTFTDTSKGTPTSWFWDFGDGETSTEQNPVHLYRITGTFNISLQACNTGACGWKNSTNRIRITMNTSFTVTPTAGNADLPVTFNDTSQGTPTSWTWTFGDGGNSTLQNPHHTYIQAGSYSVSLRACRGSTCTTLTKSAYINVSTNASFISDVTTGPYPLTVHFYDTSPGNPSSWRWIFGDGGSSTTRNATHTYQPGVYEVDFRACRGAFCTWSNQTTYITAVPVAAFTANQTSGTGNLVVQFSDRSPGTPTAWFWDFGDGTTSDLQNPVHEYMAAGIYDVHFSACRNGACGWSNRSGYITLNMDTRFTADQTAGNANLEVWFTDASRGSPESWFWDFGDGTTSGEQNPSHTYVQAGLYEVDLQACRGTACSWSNQTDYINVLMVANFIADPNSGNADLAVRFTDQAKGSPDSWFWDFGDETTSIEQNPFHTYGKAGTYEVDFQACRGTLCAWENRTDSVNVKMNTSFTADPVSGEGSLTVQFADTSHGSPDSWFWVFGDDSTSVDQNPFHTYEEAGRYEVDLRACRGTLCAWENRTGFITVGVTASFTADVLSGNAPLTVQFTETSTGVPDVWYWEFGDGTTSTLPNPSHLYPTAGMYGVKLRVCRDNLCEWENKTPYIEVTQPPSSPQSSIRITGGGSGTRGGSSVVQTGTPHSGPYIIAFDDATPVSRITLQFQEPVRNPIVNIGDVDSLPAGVSPPSGSVGQYFGIEVTDAADLSFAVIDFSVQNEWLHQNGFSPAEVVLLEYQASRWIRLPTEYLSSDAEESHFQAKTFGLPHLFAVTGPAPTGGGGVEQAGPAAGPVSWLSDNSFPVSLLGAGLLFLTFLSVRRYLRRRREEPLDDDQQEGRELVDGLLEGGKEKAFSAIIDILNNIDAQLNDLELIFAIKGPGYAFPQRNAKTMVDRFFFSCQVAERRIKNAASASYITREQVVYLNEQLQQSVNRMVDISKQSDILASLVMENLGVSAAV